MVPVSFAVVSLALADLAETEVLIECKRRPVLGLDLKKERFRAFRRQGSEMIRQKRAADAVAARLRRHGDRQDFRRIQGTSGENESGQPFAVFAPERGDDGRLSDDIAAREQALKFRSTPWMREAQRVEFCAFSAEFRPNAAD